eukprot:g2355.t1
MNNLVDGLSFKLFKLKANESVMAVHDDVELLRVLERLRRESDLRLHSSKAKSLAVEKSVEDERKRKKILAATTAINSHSPPSHPGVGAGGMNSSNSTDVTVIVEKFRRSLFEHGARGIISLGRKFRIIDDDNSGALDLQEFKKAISEHSMNLNDQELHSLFNYFDRDSDGTVNFEEFLGTIRGKLNDRRKSFVQQAFATLDVNGDGIVDSTDLIGRYDASKHPEVLAGRKTTEEVFKEFLDTFDAGDKDGTIHPDEFLRYYEGVSASIDEDDYFELMMRNAWHISGGEGWCENTTNKRVLMTDSRGRQTVEEIQNDFDIDKSDKDAMVANLRNQGKDVQDISTVGNIQEISSVQEEEKGKRGKSSGGGTSSIVFG